MSTEGQIGDGDAAAEQSQEELLTQLELLTEENQQLRDSYTQAKQTQYQRTAAGLGLIGLIAGLSGVVVPTASDVLFILCGIGLFSGVLTYYITPEQFVSADVGRDVYTSLAGNEAALAAELGLAETRMYIPVDATGSVRLFVPQQEPASPPDTALLDQTLVIAEDGAARGLALDPSGQRLFNAVETAMTGPLGTAAEPIAEQLTDAVVEQFELATTVTPDLDDTAKQLTVGVAGSVYGPLDRFDHPIPSLFATGLAQGLDMPVSVKVTETTDERADYVFTCQWGDDEESQ